MVCMTCMVGLGGWVEFGLVSDGDLVSVSVRVRLRVHGARVFKCAGLCARATRGDERWVRVPRGLVIELVITW